MKKNNNSPKQRNLWVLEGVSDEAKRFAKTESKKEKLKIGKWVDQAILVYSGLTLKEKELDEVRKILEQLKNSHSKHWWKFW